MYRTEKTKELVLKGIPESMRGDLWLLFSGETTWRNAPNAHWTFVCPYANTSLNTRNIHNTHNNEWTAVDEKNLCFL